MISNSSRTDEERYEILNTDWPTPATFPATKFGSRKRSFVPAWLTQYPGLVYSKKTDGAFCRYCVAFSTDVRGALVNKPFRDWKDAKAKFNAHFCGIVPPMQTSKHGGKGYNTHCQCKVFSEELLNNIKHKTNVQLIQDKALQERENKNSKVIESVAKTVLLCGRQNLALRGDRDDSKYLTSEKNTGNFQALLNFRIESGDTTLKEHLSNAPKNATYRSKTIQNELINIIGKQIQQHIVNEINKAGGWFSVSADEVQDVSNKEQLAICVRYVDENDEIKEKFMTLHDVSGDTSGEALSTEILAALHSLRLDPNKLRSQCYDGAGNMMGKVKGVAARIQQQFPKALPFWCSSHLLNRCIVAACEVKEVRNMMGIADQCCRFFNNSSKRQTYLNHELELMENHTKRQKLKELCRTRWVQRHDAFEVFLDFLPSVVDALNQILETEHRSDAVTDTNGILNAITTFNFIITLIVVLRCLSYIKALSIVLQGRALDVVEALRNVSYVHETLKDKRTSVETFHTQLYTEAVSVAEQMGIYPAIPRRCGRQTQRNNVPACSPEEYFKRTLTIPFLDHLIQQFEERFTRLHERATTALLLIPPVEQTLSASSLDYFHDDLPSPGSLQADIECWRKKWANQVDTPKTLSHTLKECNKHMYPNIHTILQIVATFPVTSCECERSISTLGNVKTSLRSTMAEERLTGLCLMSVHRDIEVNVTKVVSTFARQSQRRMRLPDIFHIECDSEDEIR